MRKRAYVYQIINTVTGEKYIGSTSDETKQKMRERRLDKKHSLGYKRTDAERKIISDRMKAFLQLGIGVSSGFTVPTSAYGF